LVYKNITLITNTEIIKQIFTLVCNKLSINLEIYPNDLNITKTDILIYEDINYNKDEIIRYKSMCNVLAVIAKQKVYEYEGCFLIKKPFLPSALVGYISELVDSIKEVEEKQEKKEINTIDDIEDLSFDMSNDVDDLVDFIDTIDEVKNEEISNEEDIIIKKSDLGHGGVLDQKELNNLHNIISEDDTIKEEIIEDHTNNIDDFTKEEGEWLELNDIIDDALEDISTQPVEEDVLLVLNNYTMEELTPLLNKLDQTIIDKISSGSDVNIKLRLEK